MTEPVLPIIIPVLWAWVGALGWLAFGLTLPTYAHHRRRLQHPHALPLFDSGTAAGRLSYSMPCVATGSRAADG
jgi:hypothetical protein